MSKYNTYKIKVTAVDYSVEDEDVWEIVCNEHPDIEEDSDEFIQLVDEKIEEIKNSLPQELDLEITCEKADIEDMVVDAVSEETFWLINSCSYEIVSKKQ